MSRGFRRAFQAFYSSAVVQEALQVQRTGGRSRPPWRLVALVAVPALGLVVVAGAVVVHVRQSALQRDDIREISAAFQRADCPGAVAAFDSARNRTILYGSRTPVPAGALDQVEQCGELDRARGLADDGEPADAVAAYLQYLKDHRASPLGRVIPDRLGRVLRDGDPPITSGLCRDLADVVAADELAPHETFPPFFTECGLKLADGSRTEDRERARSLLGEVRRVYPTSSVADRAATAEARTRVLLGGDDGTMSSPYRVEGVSSLASVRYVNHTPWPAVLAVSSAKAGRVVELPGCENCDLYDESSNGPTDCESDGAEGVTIDLSPGAYRVAIQYVGDNAPPDNSGRWTLSRGKYAECYYGIK
jgi:hypothetical protein